MPPPVGGVYRVARRLRPPFAPPPWGFADPETGTFGNRFDDPGQADGVPEAGRFRVISCATAKAGAYAEVLASLRPSLALVAEIRAHGAGSDSAAVHSLGYLRAPGPLQALPAEWRAARQVGHAVLDPSLVFADLASARTLAHLRSVTDLARLARTLGLADIDLSAVTGPHRAFTQACARYLHEFDDEAGRQFAGIRYLSRLGEGPDRECWALFDDRIRFVGGTDVTGIAADDPDLLVVARLYHLAVEPDPS